MVSEEYLHFIVEQLEDMGVIRVKKMFGGAGLYCDDIIFALVSDDTLYFKVDDSNRDDYLNEGMEPFKPYGSDSYMMSYYEVPIAVLEDKETIINWGRKSVKVSVKNGKKKKKK